MGVKEVDITLGGPCLYYDSTMKTFSLISGDEEKPEVRFLGSVETTVLVLQHELGLSRSQAAKAVATAFSNIGAPIRLDQIKKFAKVSHIIMDDSAYTKMAALLPTTKFAAAVQDKDTVSDSIQKSLQSLKEIVPSLTTYLNNTSLGNVLADTPDELAVAKAQTLAGLATVADFVRVTLGNLDEA